jgi:hypothetical protein
MLESTDWPVIDVGALIASSPFGMNEAMVRQCAP